MHRLLHRPQAVDDLEHFDARRFEPPHFGVRLIVAFEEDVVKSVRGQHTLDHFLLRPRPVHDTQILAGLNGLGDQPRPL
jgi:hypothetical protein